MCEWGGMEVGNSPQSTDKKVILDDPVKAVSNGDSRINKVYAEYLGLSFADLNQTQLSPAEKAIILFVQATTANTLEQIESYQTHILSLLGNEDFKATYGILELSYAVYIEKLKSINSLAQLKQAIFTQAKQKVLQNPIVKEQIDNSDLESFAKWTPSV